MTIQSTQLRHAWPLIGLCVGLLAAPLGCSSSTKTTLDPGTFRDPELLVPDANGLYSLHMTPSKVAGQAHSETDLTGTWDQLFADYAVPGVPGASVTIVHGGAVLFQRSYGLAELPTGAALDAKNNFYLASMSKQFTAMGIVMLKEAGLLGYDDPISRFFPHFAAPGRNVTVRQLLHHTGGLKSYFALLNPTAPIYSKDVLDALSKQTSTNFPPGTKYEYSNSGYVVLGQIIAKLSGMSYGDFMTQRIFTPLGMTGTTVFEAPDAAIPNRCYGYALGSDGSYALSDASGDNWYSIVGDGGIYSSVVDLARWDEALYGQQLVSAASLTDIFTSGKLNDGTATNYGFGWNVGQDHNQPYEEHGGLYDGFHSAIQRYPQSHFSVIILTNRAEGDPAGLAQKAADAYFAP